MADSRIVVRPDHGSAPQGVDDSEGFAPLELLNQTLHFWWLLFILTLIGGLAGWAIHRMRPPVFEAVGHFSASIDFVATGPLSQYEEDVALNAIGDLIISPPLLQRVSERAKEAGIQVKPVDLVRMASVERKFTVWDLRVRSEDPQYAAQIANLWVEEGQALLLESYEHALQAEQIQRHVDVLESCLAHSAVSESSSVLCERSRFVEIQADLKAAGDALYKERLASRGIFSGLTIGPADSAAVPDKAAIFGRSQLVLAGTMLGFLLGVVLLSLGIPARWLKRR